MTYIYMYQFPEFMVKISSVVCMPTLAVEVSCPISMLLTLQLLYRLPYCKRRVKFLWKNCFEGIKR